jgi:hypothetical protein
MNSSRKSSSEDRIAAGAGHRWGLYSGLQVDFAGLEGVSHEDTFSRRRRDRQHVGLPLTEGGDSGLTADPSLTVPIVHSHPVT